MVMVLVAMALGMILVGVLMNISMLNYQMKTTEYKAKDNFYSAEIVMDQIHAGLEQEVADAVGTSYSKTMQSYGMPDETGNLIDINTRLTEFRQNYVVTLRNNLQGTDDKKYLVGCDNTVADLDTNYNATTGLYTKGLLAYLDKDLADMYRRGVNGDSTNIVRITSADGNYTMISTEEGLVLKNLQVVYVDSEGFYSQIQTDIRIGFPNISLQESSVIPNVFDYSLIADAGVISEANTATIKDSIYAGTHGASEGDGGIKVMKGSLAFDGAENVVSKGEIRVSKNAKLDFYDGKVWAQGIDIAGGKLNSAFSGPYKQPSVDYYVADDLTISSRGSVVNLSGNYYGFNGKLNSVDPLKRNSSAIVVNGSSTTLKMTDLEDLMLGGNAYIGAGRVEFSPSKEDSSAKMNSGQNQDILLGNSLSVKTDQIVYLVPAECLGTVDGETTIGHNPMTREEYKRWISETTVGYQKLDLNKKTTLLGKSLAGYFAGDTNEEHYQTVFRNVNGESICYVFLKMTEDNAAAYYRDYVAAATESIQKYANKYKNNISINAALTDISSRGNIFSYNTITGSVSIQPNTIADGTAEQTAFESKRQKLQYNYDALCSKLTMNYDNLSREERELTVYHNLINTDALSALGTNGKKTYDYNGFKAVVINNKGEAPLVVQQSSDKVKLVIASGDVEIRGSFSGLIITDGTLKLAEATAVEVKADKDNVTSLLQATASGDSKSLIETYFVNGSRYVLNGSSGSNGSGQILNLADVIAYQNWTKQ